jgi:hypothetical protein
MSERKEYKLGEIAVLNYADARDRNGVETSRNNRQ